MFKVQRLWQVGVLLAVALGPVPAGAQAPDAEVASAGLISAVAAVWARSYALKWEGPRVVLAEEPSPTGELVAASRAAFLYRGPGVTVDEAHLQRAQRALDLAHQRLSARGWPVPIGGPLQVFVLSQARPDRPTAEVSALTGYLGLDRARTYATVEQGLIAFDPEACAVEAYARALLLSMDPGESADWRGASARTLAESIVGRSCTNPVHRADEEPLHDPQSIETIGAVASMRELWELGQQQTWDGSGVRASPNLWEVLAYIVQNKEAARTGRDVWLQFVERLLAARAQATEPAVHPPFTSKTRRIWGSVAGLAPLGVDVVQFPAESGAPFQIWLRAEPGTRWFLFAQARDATGRSLASFKATSKNRLDSASEVVIFHPLEALPKTAMLWIAVGNMGGGAAQLATPELERRAYNLVIARDAHKKARE